MKKAIGIIVVLLIIIVSLGLSVYLPNKEKIESEVEDKSIIYSVINENNKYGVKNQNDEIVIAAKYDKIIIPNEHRAVFFCKSGEITKILNDNNDDIFKGYDDVKPIQLTNAWGEVYEKNALIYQKNNKYGLISITGKVILDARYEEIYNLGNKENEIIIKDNNKYKIYDIKGKELIKDEFDSIVSDNYYTEQDEYKKSGYIVCKITSAGYRYGYYDYEYNKVLDIEYNSITRILEVQNKNNIYLLAAKNGQYGVFINNTKIINTQYQSIKYDSDLKMFIVERTGKFGALSETGAEILKTEYNALEIKGIYMYAEKDGEKKVYDKDGKEIDIPYTTTIERTKNSNYFIKIENSKYGFVNENMEVIVNCEYDLIQSIEGTNCFQAIKNETDTTYIFNNNLEKVAEMNNASIEAIEGVIRVYNETDEVKLDVDGNIQNAENN